MIMTRFDKVPKGGTNWGGYYEEGDDKEDIWNIKYLIYWKNIEYKLINQKIIMGGGSLGEALAEDKKLTINMQ